MPQFCFYSSCDYNLSETAEFPRRLRGTPCRPPPPAPAPRPQILPDEEGSWERGLMEAQAANDALVQSCPQWAQEAWKLPLLPCSHVDSETLSSWQSPPVGSLRNDKPAPRPQMAPRTGRFQVESQEPLHRRLSGCGHPHVTPLLSLTPPQGNPGVHHS